MNTGDVFLYKRHQSMISLIGDSSKSKSNLSDRKQISGFPGEREGDWLHRGLKESSEEMGMFHLQCSGDGFPGRLLSVTC